MHIRIFSCGANADLFSAAAPPTKDDTTTVGKYYAISPVFKAFRTARGNTLYITTKIAVCTTGDTRCAVSSDLYCDFFYKYVPIIFPPFCESVVIFKFRLIEISESPEFLYY